jgi:hypothetical protein
VLRLTIFCKTFSSARTPASTSTAVGDDNDVRDPPPSQRWSVLTYSILLTRRTKPRLHTSCRQGIIRMDDDFGADDDFLAALAATAAVPPRPNPPVSRPQQPTPQRIQQPAPQRVQQPTPQRLDKAPPAAASASGPKVVQPIPQALPGRSSGSSILVSPRQKGNPVLACLKSMPWEYSDIPADYGLGLTTCALFLR